MRDGLGRFGVIVAVLIVGIVAVVSLSSAWLALIVGSIVVGLVGLDVMLHGATGELADESTDEPTPKRLTIDLDKRAK